MISSTAVTMVAAADVRRQRWSLLVSMLVVALVCGVVFATVAGARRTSSALDRWEARYPTADLWIGVADPHFAADVGRMDALETELAALAGVERVEGAPNIFVVTDLGESFTFTTGADPSYLEYVSDAVRVIDGRLPTVGGFQELAINEAAADQLGLATGDVLPAPMLSVETAAGIVDGTGDFVVDGPELTFDVVGVYRDSLDVEPAPGAIASPDSGAVIGAAGSFEAGFALFGPPDEYLDRALALAADAAPGAEVYHSARETWSAPVRSTFDMLAAGLVVFAVVAGVAGLIAVAQLVSRQVNQAAAVAPVIRSLGMDRNSVVLGLATSSIVIGIAGVALGSILAVAASPMFPISSARLAEPDPGVHVDWIVLLVGAAIALAALVAWALAVATRLVRSEQDAAAPIQESASLGFRRGLPVSAGIGVGSVVSSGHARTRARPGSAIVGAVLGIAGLVAIAVFLASLHATTTQPARFGWGWDRQVYLENEAVVDALAADERLAGVGTGSCSTASLDGTATSLCTLEVRSGSLSLTYLEGRAPNSPGEAAAGRVTMNDHDLSVGTTVEVVGPTGATTWLTIVGVAVQPDPNSPGSGLVTTPAAFARLVPAAGNFSGILLLDYPPSADAQVLDATISSDYPFEVSAGDFPVPPDAVRQLERIRPTLVALAVFLGILGAIGLAHFLLLSTNRRRHDTAVLRSLGFVRWQSVVVVVWQALTVLLIGSAIGAPIGIAIGRRVWVASVDQVGIVDTPTMPWFATTLILGASVAGAAGVATVSGWWSTRRNPAVVLRTE